MAALHASRLLSISSCAAGNGRYYAALQAPKATLSGPRVSLPALLNLKIEEPNVAKTKIEAAESRMEIAVDPSILFKLHALAEAVADRAEMHFIIGEQRADWNKLLLNSINAMTLTAATMAGLSTMVPSSASFSAFNFPATILYSAATALLLVMNKIQPSQLAEEQRSVTRLFRRLHAEIQNTLAVRRPTKANVEEAVERVLALDKAYPLPLLPGMLEKFPKKVEPTVWWPPKELKQKPKQPLARIGNNGWSENLEEEMRGILKVLQEKDVAEYVRLSQLVLKVNKILAVSGPLLTGLAAALVGSPFHGPWAALVGATAGALATVVNTFEHGGQVGMVFEMYRNCAGFYRHSEELIDSTLKEDVEMRENGELFEMKLALELGRSLAELRDLASSAGNKNTEFAGKLF